MASEELKQEKVKKKNIYIYNYKRWRRASYIPQKIFHVKFSLA